MINYRYICESCGETTDRAQSSDSIKKRIKCACGKMARRLLGCNTSISANWNKPCSALHVNPEEMADVQAVYAKAGVDCEHDKRGDAILTSRGHRNQVLAARGMFDRDAGYGDRTPTTSSSDKDKGEKHEYSTLQV